MRKLALLFLLLAFPAAAQVQDETGAQGAYTPDRSTTCTLDSLNDVCVIGLEGRRGAGLLLSTSNLSATLTPELSFDGGATWTNGYLFDPSSWVDSFTVAYTGGAATTQKEFRVAGGVTNARVRLSAYTSGTATATVRATTAAGSVLVRQAYGSDPWFVTGWLSNGAASYGTPVEVAGKDGGNLIRQILTDTAGRPETTPAQVTSANNDGACVSVSVSTTLLASLATRKGFTLFPRETNTDVVHVRFASGAATTADLPLPPGTPYNMYSGVVYTGAITAIAASGTQSVCVAEF